VRGPSLSLLTAALLALAASQARAQAHADEPTVAVSVDACVPIDRAALQRILTVELGTSTIQHDAALAAQAPTRVHIGCAQREILLRLEDGVTSKVMTRALPRQSFVDPSSTRLLALAVAEFVVASWVELQVQPTPAVRPLPVAPAPTARTLQRVSEKVKALPGPRAATEEHITLSLGPTFQLYALETSPFWGGSGRVLGTAGRLLAWSVSGDVAGGGSELSVGDLDAITASISLSALLQARLGTVALYTGPAARVGLARIAGTTDDATRARGKIFFAPFGGPAWLLRVELSPTRVLRLGVDVELGYVTLPARATIATRSVYSIDGLWGTTTLWAGAGF
jgi:hypothetical protein